MLTYAAIIITLTTGTSKVFADPNFRLQESEPFWYVSMNFEGYHVNFDIDLPDFTAEIETQNLTSFLSGDPFSVYQSEIQWGIGYNLRKRKKVNPPLYLSKITSPAIVTCSFNNTCQDLSIVYSEMARYIKHQNYRNDGPLIVLSIKNSSDEYEVIMPVRKDSDFDRVFVQSFGVFRIIVTFLLVLFTIFIFFYRARASISNKLLGIFIVIVILNNLQSFLWIYGINNIWPHLYQFSFPLTFAVGPIILLYTQSMIKPYFRLNRWHILHFFPCMLVTGFYVLSYQIHDTETKTTMIRSDFFNGQEFRYLNLAFDVQYITYLVVALIFLRLYHRSPEFLKSDQKTQRLTWLKIILYGLLILEFADVSKQQVKIFTGYHNYFSAITLSLMELFFISLLVIRSLRFPEVFTVSDQDKGKEKYSKSPLRDEHKIYYLNKLEEFMRTEKPYLSSSIKLPDLSKEISVPVRYLSQILNESIQMNFYDYMNYYRIQEVKNMLSNAEQSHKSVIEIAYECGFNSKSVFNTAFKKTTGLTPTRYRNEHCINQVQSI